MNPEIEIKITTRGIVREGEEARAEMGRAPEPDPSMGASGAGMGITAEAAPSPHDIAGAAEMVFESPPSPEMGPMAASGAASEELPTPVPLDEIEQLGSSTPAVSVQNGPPTPEDEQG